MDVVDFTQKATVFLLCVEIIGTMLAFKLLQKAKVTSMSAEIDFARRSVGEFMFQLIIALLWPLYVHKLVAAVYNLLLSEYKRRKDK